MAGIHGTVACGEQCISIEYTSYILVLMLEKKNNYSFVEKNCVRVFKFTVKMGSLFPRRLLVRIRRA